MAVQRRFDVVLRGYDPAEVDAHLKRVSEWFSQSRAGRLAREQERRFIVREEEVSAREREVRELLEGARVEERATLEGARLRAESQLREAERIRAEADTERDRILDEARLQAAAAEITTAAQDSRRPPDRRRAPRRPSGSPPTPRPSASSSWRRLVWRPSS